VGEPRRLRIKDWPEGDRPREKLLRLGARNLSDAELLAILLRTGRKGITALDLARSLFSGGRTLKELSGLSADALRQQHLGESRAVALAAAFELARRVSADDTERPLIRAPEDVVRAIGPLLQALTQEEFWVLPLSSSNRLLRPARITVGTLNASLVHPRECFRPAIERSAAAVIFVHNHPSGNPEPSQEDIAITRQLTEAGRVLGIPVHDHVILAGSRFTSFAERGLLG